jgi:hypothetical protein
MKTHAIATLIVRGNALAMLVVAAKAILDLSYAFCDPAYSYQFERPGALRSSLIIVAFELILGFLLFFFSQRVGRLLCRGLTESEPQQ